MDGPEREIIRRFAAGERDLRDEAICIHRAHMRLLGLRHGDAHFDFMSEVDNPCPDLLLRSRYRERVIATGVNITLSSGDDG